LKRLLFFSNSTGKITTGAKIKAKQKYTVYETNFALLTSLTTFSNLMRSRLGIKCLKSDIMAVVKQNTK
jgi:hypothetical protein